MEDQIVSADRSAETNPSRREAFRIETSGHHPRLQELHLSGEVLEEFFAAFRSVDARELRLRPYMRFVLADGLQKIAGESLRRQLHELLLDREKGGLLAGVGEFTRAKEDFLKFATALTHLIGVPNRDPSGGQYYASLVIEGAKDPDSYQLGATAPLVLHTDGVYEEMETDWIFFMKMEERAASGGETRLLHMDDWEDLERLSSHPLAFENFVFKSELFDLPAVEKPFLFKQGDDLRIRFNDQEARPRNIQEALFIRDMQTSLQNSAGARTLPLRVGSLVLMNNTYWLHGRDAFSPHPDLYREIIRQRGVFAVAAPSSESSPNVRWE